MGSGTNDNIVKDVLADALDQQERRYPWGSFSGLKG